VNVTTATAGAAIVLVLSSKKGEKVGAVGVAKRETEKQNSLHTSKIKY
jgi:hypothetical protein